MDEESERLRRWLQEWADDPERGGRAVHAAWVEGMQRQLRIVERDRQRWEILNETDRILDAMIARKLVERILYSFDA